MDECKIPPAGWRCTRAPGHSGPCAAVRIEAGVPVRRRAWLFVAFVISVVMWVLIVCAFLAWLGKPEVKPDARTACERSNPPWSIAERCR